MRHDGTAPEGGDAPLSDGPLLDLLDALVEQRGRVAAAQALGVNYRTMTNCHESRRVSRRMGQALEKFRDEREASGGEDGTAVDGDGETEAAMEALARRVAALEEENRWLREMLEAQGNSMKASERSGDSVEERERRREERESVGVGDDQGQWRPPRRRSGLVDVGVVTMETQPDEEDAFGPAAPLVAEWRELRTGSKASGGRVERAQATVRRWELEVAMLRDFRLTLPPETEPLDDARKADHLRWREDALAEARREVARARRMQLLRRVLTLGLRWR